MTTLVAEFCRKWTKILLLIKLSVEIRLNCRRYEQYRRYPDVEAECHQDFLIVYYWSSWSLFSVLRTVSVWKQSCLVTTLISACIQGIFPCTWAKMLLLSTIIPNILLNCLSFPVTTINSAHDEKWGFLIYLLIIS